MLYRLDNTLFVINSILISAYLAQETSLRDQLSLNKLINTVITPYDL